MEIYIFFVLITFLELTYLTLAVFEIENLFLDYFYKTVEFSMLGLFLNKVVNKQWITGVTLGAIILYILTQLYLAYSQGLTRLNDIGNIINSVFLFFYSFGVLLYLLKNSIVFNLFQSPNFNFVLGIFLIFLTDILVDVILKYAYFQANTQIQFIILISRNFIKSLYLFLFLKGILIINKKSKPNTSND